MLIGGLIMAKESGEKKGTFSNILIILFLLTTLVTSGALIYGIYLYDGVETLIRYIVMGIIVLNDLRLILKARKYIKGKMKKNKKPKKKLLLFSLFFFLLIIHQVYSKYNNDYLDMQKFH